MLSELQPTPADATVPHLTDDEARAAARAVVNLFDRWDLTDEQACELLGGLAPRTWARWKKGNVNPVEGDRAARLSLLLGIHKCLRYISGPTFHASTPGSRLRTLPSGDRAHWT